MRMRIDLHTLNVNLHVDQYSCHVLMIGLISYMVHMCSQRLIYVQDIIKSK